MSVGPILIFDKSVLESLSVDESVWLQTHYLNNITPLFYVETLADLEKDFEDGRTPDQVVSRLAEKTPTGGRPNVHHLTLCMGELLGHAVEMRGHPIIGGVQRSGKGTVSKTPIENEALNRWEGREFLELERSFAKQWRMELTNLDLQSLSTIGKKVIESLGRPRNPLEAKTQAVQLLGKYRSRYVRELLKKLLPPRVQTHILERWISAGMPPIHSFAPYTSHVLTVDLFFCICLASHFIEQGRPSNKIDIAYLYYLPFCMVFSSKDKLHKKTAPLFLTERQVFVSGEELKADLARLDEYYSTFPDDIKARGVLSFAHFPPLEGDFLITKLWDKLMNPDWRLNVSDPKNSMSREEEAKILEKMNEKINASRKRLDDNFSFSEAEYMIIEHKVPFSKGKWRLLPAETKKDRL